MPPINQKCEGYWDSPSPKKLTRIQDRIKNKSLSQAEIQAIYEQEGLKGYQPLISTRIWSGKQEWLKKAYAIEEYFYAPYRDYILNGKSFPGQLHYRAYRGLSPSRIVPGYYVGNGEYEDGDMCWPEGYVKHYIEDHNVMPTQRFYDYVNTRYETLSNS